MRNFFYTAAATLLAFSVSQSAQAGVIATYDFSTGEVIFADATGDVGFRINSSPDNFSGEQPTDLGGAAAGGFGVVNQQPSFIEWGNLTGLTFDGPRSAGFIIVPGTDPAELEFLVATAANPGSPEVRPLNVVNVPEPTSACLLLLAASSFAMKRRRG